MTLSRQKNTLLAGLQVQYSIKSTFALVQFERGERVQFSWEYLDVVS
jgi:hypothetical protein